MDKLQNIVYKEIDKIILGIIIIISLCNSNVAAQPCNLTPEDKQEIIDSLYSTNYEIRYKSIEKVLDRKIIEATKIIEEKFWELDPKWLVLKTLYKLGSNMTYDYAVAYYDTIQKGIDQLHLTVDSNLIDWYKYVDLEEQVGVIEILFKLNDFSKADKVIELLDYDSKLPKNSYAMDALKYLIKNVPQYSERAKSELENAIASDKYSGWDRLNYFYDLHDVYRGESYQMAKTMFLNDPDIAVRLSLLNFLPIYTYLYHNEEVLELLKNRLTAEPDTSFFPQEIVNTLLHYYGTPATYNYLKEFSAITTNSDLARSIIVDLRFFKPVKPNDTAQVNLNVMLDSLQSYNQQCLELNWVDNSLQGDLSSKIQNAKTYLSSGDSLNCAKYITQYQDLIDFEYNDTLSTTIQFVTREGWQFLYNYAQYILDRLPRLPLGE